MIIVIYFYADRNVRPWTILGYTLTTFPKVTRYIDIYSCTTREEIRTFGTIARNKKHLHLMQGKGTLHNWWRISGHQVFYTAREKLNKDKEGGNL